MNSDESKYTYVKTYVDVIVRMRTDGSFIPIKVVWEGITYKVDKVIKISTSPPRYVGAGVTIRHTCLICGKERELYLEDYPRRWFVEKRVINF